MPRFAITVRHRFATNTENMAAAAGRGELTLVDLSMAEPRTIVPNVPLSFENDAFEGTMLMLLRGFGEKKNDKRESPPLFELQVQGRFKQDMDGADLFLGCELPVTYLRLSVILVAAMRVVLAWVSTRLHGLHWSFGEKPPSTRVRLPFLTSVVAHEEEGDKLRTTAPHIVLPLVSALDRLLESTDLKCPELGTTLVETEQDRERKHGSYSGELNNKSTYTMSFFNNHTSFSEWKAVGVPLGPILFSKLVGSSPIHIVVYKLQQDCGNGHDGATPKVASEPDCCPSAHSSSLHIQCHKRYLMKLELRWEGGSDV